MILVPRLSFAVAVASALIASQLPEFAQQYRQGLIGHIGELTRQQREFDDWAQSQGLTRDALLGKLESSADKDTKALGSQRAEDFVRLQQFKEQLVSFVTAGPVGRIFVLMRDFDPQIASDAYANFEPAIPTTSEGFISAFVGFLVGAGLIRLGALPFRRRPRQKLPPILDPRQAEIEQARNRSIMLRERINRYTLPSASAEHEKR